MRTGDSRCVRGYSEGERDDGAAGAETKTVGGMSSTGERMLGLEKQRMLDHVAQNGDALEYAADELKGDREIVLAAVAQYGPALQHAAAELKGDREIVLEAVAQNGRALEYAAAPLNRHRALQWIRSTNVKLHCAHLRLALATCALPTPLNQFGDALSALPRDLIELIGTCILPEVAIYVVARKYRYWCDIREDPGHKKRKRLHEDDAIE